MHMQIKTCVRKSLAAHAGTCPGTLIQISYVVGFAYFTCFTLV